MAERAEASTEVPDCQMNSQRRWKPRDWKRGAGLRFLGWPSSKAFHRLKSEEELGVLLQTHKMKHELCRLWCTDSPADKPTAHPDFTLHKYYSSSDPPPLHLLALSLSLLLSSVLQLLLLPLVLGSAGGKLKTSLSTQGSKTKQRSRCMLEMNVVLNSALQLLSTLFS